MTDIALDEKAMGAAVAEPDDTQWHTDRMDSIVRDLWAANDIDLHMCNDTVKRNQSGLLHDIRNSWRIVRRALATAPTTQVAPANPAQVTDAQIEHMVQQFLRWKLPDDFAPDGGISFTKVSNVATPYEYRHEPVGTNLFDYRQAKAMIQHMLDGLAAIGAGGQAVAVKPLEWFLFEDDWWSADSIIGGYEVRQGKASARIRFPSKSRFEEFAGTVDEAKAAAQADYEQRILSALSQPHPADERVAPTKGVSNKAEEGRQAYKSGQPKDSNPYPNGTTRYWQWSSGWLDEQAFRPRPDERVMEALRKLSTPPSPVQKLGAAISRRDWHEAEQAHAFIRDALDGFAKEGR